MTSVSYLIVCINLLYVFDHSESCSPTKLMKVWKEEKELSSLTPENQNQYLVKLFTPYYNLPYDEQLKKKQDNCNVTFNEIVNQFQSSNISIRCKLLDVVPSPVTKHYRNKDEFQIRPGLDGNPKTVGCVVVDPKLRKSFAIHPSKIITIKEIHKRVAQVYEDFIRLSPTPPALKENDGGHWNTLIVRSNEVGDIMASVTVKPKGYSYKMIKVHQKALKEYFFKHLPYITLYHQVCSKDQCNPSESPFSLLYGKRFIMETLNGNNFKITPGTIFPYNKFATEVLYDTIISTAKLNFKTTVIDIFSGTGIKSIMVSKFVKEVIGLEHINYFFGEAKNLMYINNIRNVKIVMGRVHNKISSALKGLEKSSDVVAMLNYRSTGIASNVINTIVRSSQISRLLYFFWRPNNQRSIQTLVDLCTTNYSSVIPFKLTKVIPFDVLPQTAYVEYILIFQREARQK